MYLRYFDMDNSPSPSSGASTQYQYYLDACRQTVFPAQDLPTGSPTSLGKMSGYDQEQIEKMDAVLAQQLQDVEDADDTVAVDETSDTEVVQTADVPASSTAEAPTASTTVVADIKDKKKKKEAPVKSTTIHFSEPTLLVADEKFVKDLEGKDLETLRRLCQDHLDDVVQVVGQLKAVISQIEQVKRDEAKKAKETAEKTKSPEEIAREQDYVRKFEMSFQFGETIKRVEVSKDMTVGDVRRKVSEAFKFLKKDWMKVEIFIGATNITNNPRANLGGEMMTKTFGITVSETTVAIVRKE